jgi:AmpE protein
MTLISLILVLLAERMAAQSKYWQANFYTSALFGQLEQKGILKEQGQGSRYLLVVGFTAIIAFLLLVQIDNVLLKLIIDTAILMVCIGCPAIRETYKCYLQAANRGDFQACSLYAEQLGYEQHNEATFGQNLVWLNYQHYAAVIIWFAVLGPTGAIFYVLAREGAAHLQNTQHDAAENAIKLMKILDWVPVRITALGFLLVGHFSRALPIWLGYFADIQVSARQLLCEVSRAAEEVEPDENDCTEEPCTLVRLAKRNILFLVVVISVLSLSGWLP